MANINNLDEQMVRGLYTQLLDQWNKRHATGFADLFTTDGSLVGFDGSQVDGQSSIADHLTGIFANHKTPTYVSAIREVRFLFTDVALLRAVSGLVPDGKKDLDPALHAIQSLVAVRKQTDADFETLMFSQWRIALFQNTPAGFHGRPEETARLTQELRARLV